MSDLVVHGFIVSQPTRSVLAYLKLSGVAYTYQHVDLMGGGTSTEEFTRINPYQAIPVIVHEGYSVWESAAIIPYVADSFNLDNQWYPKDAKLRARINAYFHWHHQNVRDPCAGYLFPKLLGPKVRGQPELTEEQEAPLKARHAQFLSELKWTLADTGFVARSSGPTIADVFAFNEISATFTLFNLEEHPEIKTWVHTIGAIPEVKELTDQAMEIFSKVLAG